jgi:hypothetical protein
LENLLYGEYHQFYLKYQEKFTTHPFWQGQGPPPPMGGSPLAVWQRIRTKRNHHSQMVIFHPDGSLSQVNFDKKRIGMYMFIIYN